MHKKEVKTNHLILSVHLKLVALIQTISIQAVMFNLVL